MTDPHASASTLPSASSQIATEPGPHAGIPTRCDREALLAQWLDALWDRYRQRVAYAREYQRLLSDHGARFVNDHVAFRTIATQQPMAGIVSLARLFEALGYEAAGCYQFPDKALSAVHYQHPQGLFPKVFLSELQPWKLSLASQQILRRAVPSHRPQPDDAFLAALATAPPADHPALLATLMDVSEAPLWDVPDEADLLALNAESQYAAWVLIHGYRVNHFTGLINAHQVDDLATIDQTIAALRTRGVPMKADVEGLPGSKLRQTTTEAVQVEVTVRRGGQLVTRPWSYAYFELAERGTVADPETGRSTRFEGFLGPQATQLFDMTRVKN
jgi:hypothetical protein